MAGAGVGADDNTAQGGHLIAAMIDVPRSVTAHHGRNNPGQDGLVSFDLAQITSGENRSNPQPGDPSRPAEVEGRPAVAYQGQGTNVGPMGTLRAGNGNVTGGVPFTVMGEVAHTLTAAGSDASEDGTGRGTPIVVAGTVKEGARYPNHESTMVPIAFGHTNGLDVQASEHVTPTLRAGHDVGGGSVAFAAAVRRLTPTECERLQGYPDGWTARSHGRAQADSVRYRQLGNSYALPVVEWIARRIVGWSA